MGGFSFFSVAIAHTHCSPKRLYQQGGKIITLCVCASFSFSALCTHTQGLSLHQIKSLSWCPVPTSSSLARVLLFREQNRTEKSGKAQSKVFLPFYIRTKNTGPQKE